MTSNRPAIPSSPTSREPLAPDGIAGVVLDAKDLANTRAFYEPIFAHARGRWDSGRRSLAFSASCGQRIEFVQRSKPRTIAHAGLHVAYRVPANHLTRLVGELEAAGHPASWWREDHPSERLPMPFLTDPSGNIVQLIGSDNDRALIDHYYAPVDDIDSAELFYLEALKGTLDSYFGYRTEDVAAAREWLSGDDVCAPWTRNKFVSFRTHAPNPTPAAQIFARYGDGYVGTCLSGQRLPEPPEEQLRGTPRVVLHTPRAPADVEAYLASVRISTVALTYDGGKVPFEREGSQFFTRDRSGNFVQIDCTG